MKAILVIIDNNNNGIGYDNKLLAHIPNDLKMFKELTVGNSVIMGRKTFESIGKPLTDRENIVLTSKKFKGVINVSSIENALNKSSKEDIFIIGGDSVYRQFIDKVDTLIISHIDYEFKEVDRYFPTIDKNIWKIVDSSPLKDVNYNVTVKTYKKWQK